MQPHPWNCWIVDAGTGQNAINQVQLFDEAVGFNGFAHYQAGWYSKGGVLFNIANRTHVPIRYIGVGAKDDHVLLG